MDRRQFLHALAATATLTEEAAAQNTAPAAQAEKPAPEGFTLVAEFPIDTVHWKVYEDLRTRDGSVVFRSSHGAERIMPKSAEATFPEANSPYLGLKLEDIGNSPADLLADRLLANGDPDPEQVKAAAPPLSSTATGQGGARGWTTFVGTKECYDTMPVYYGGNTRTYHPTQIAVELRELIAQRKLHDGLVGGWMPAVRKVFPVSANSWWELIVFGDVEAPDKFIVQTWHRTALIQDGKIAKVFYGYSYPAFPPARQDPRPEQFYRALLVFAEYWDQQMHEISAAALPENVWLDMAKHAFAKELMGRPAGVYPKYGAVDRDYYGSEYDGFQDIFTMSAYANLEWGRLETARAYIDNYFTDFVDPKGMVNMRGPETAQFGMTLSLLARYFHYTQDTALLMKHRGKIEATAQLLLDMHDASLKLPQDDPGYGLIHGWSESDACLAPDPKVFWQPYFANNAWAARGLKDIAGAWQEIARRRNAPAMETPAREWIRRSRIMQDAVVASIRKNVRRDMQPPYIGPLPGVKLTFHESLARERPSPQQWPHRAYAELLQADMLPPDLASLVIDCMRAYGATTAGVVANIGRLRPNGRSILGFISYGYAQMLLRLDRVEEYLLFLYSHRYHDHTRGSWTAGEVAGITGGSALYCIPAQQTIPLLVRWMLLLEDSDEDRLYFAKGIPRNWLVSEKAIRIDHAATRWGRVNFRLAREAQSLRGRVEFAANAPKEIHIKLRVPAGSRITEVTVNGAPVMLAGPHGDTAIIQTHSARRFDLSARLA